MIILEEDNKMLHQIIKLRLLIIFLLVIVLVSCNTRYDKQFYGTYENMDTNRFVYSKFTFYENNNYAFHYSTCFDHHQDSGKFILANSIILLHSFNLPLSDTNVQMERNSNKIEFLYQPGKVLGIRHIKPLNKPSYSDTILIGQKKI